MPVMSWSNGNHCEKVHNQFIRKSRCKDDVIVGFATKEATEKVVAQVRLWIFSHVVPSLVDTITISIIKVSFFKMKSLKHFVHVQAIEKAVAVKKLSTKTNREMAIIVTFIELILNDNLRNLNIDGISKILRTGLYEKINKFTGLNSLTLGSGSGGWSSMYYDKFANGIKTMKHIGK